ncbi:MAG: serine hydrolase [Chromatiales bacterium]|jgi:CubicO group peptidase (beta-lactamase class C family)|nr:serine hydrolase [Chromatiales bacterium]
MKWLRRLLAVLLAIVVLATVALYVADPVVATRMLSMPFGGAMGPVVPVPGRAGPGLPLAGPDARTIDGAALEAAVAYGAETGSHALLVWQGDALQLEHYYPGFGAGTRTPTQSMHKSVVALLYGAAIRDGFIGSVDDAVGKYLPEWRDDPRGQVTLRQLLQQASGIGYPRTNYLNPAGDFLQIMMGGNLEQKLLAQPAEQPPDTQFDYHNVNVGLLGIVLERAVGRPYAEYLSSALWQPIGADDATVTLDSDVHRTPRTYCCLDATARSWLRLGLLHLNDGASDGVQVLPREWMAEVVTPSRHNPGYGYLTWLGTRYQRERRYNHKSPVAAFQSEPFAAPDVRFFDGFGGQRVYVVPSHRLVIVRTGALAMDWDDARLPNLIIAGLRPAPAGR